jgi:uncharacterized membrane protein YagU involved in acid resistance
MKNIWTRALWGGIVGVIVADAILYLGRAAGWMQINILSSLASLFTTQGIASSTSGMILGFVIHLLLGIAWAIIFTAIILAFRSRHNIVAGVVNGLIVWLIWGLLFPPLGLGPGPWNMGTATTMITLLSALSYGLIVGYAVSIEAEQRKVVT